MKSGFIIIDKPEGISSFDVIRKIRRITGIRKFGHTGTLDPFATGILPLLFGKYTRLAQYISHLDKTYEVTMRLGIKTDTADITGNVVEENSGNISEIDTMVLKNFVESISSQVPPKYSAIKINGKAAYKYARENKTVEIPERDIKIYSFEVNSFDFPYLKYTASVSKGTYIRSISESIGEFLGLPATTTALRRTVVGDINISASVKLEDMTPDNWEQFLTNPADYMPSLGKLSGGEADLEKLRFGQKISVSALDKNYSRHAILDKNNQVCAVGVVKDSVFKPEMVFI